MRTGAGNLLLDTVQTSVGVSSGVAILQGITDRKKRGESLSKRVARFDKRRGDRLATCGAKIHLTTCTKAGCGYHRETFPYRCADALCPSCARRRGLKLSGTLGKGLAEYQSKNDLHAYLLTLTFKDMDALPDFTKIGKMAKRLLNQKKLWKQYGLVGGVRAFEIKIGKTSGKWHPHFHILILTKHPIPTFTDKNENIRFELGVNQAIAAAWQKITGDSFIVDGRAFDGDYREMFKYVAKGADTMDDERLRELANWQRGKRFLSLFGELYNNSELKAAMKAGEDEREEAAPHCCPECGSSLQTLEMDWNGSRYIPVRVITLNEAGPPGES